MSYKITLAHGAAILAAVCAVLLVISGALNTSAFSLHYSDGLISEGGHAHTGEVLGALLIGLLLVVAVKESVVRGLAGALCALILMEELPGGQDGGVIRLLHAVLAQVLLAGTVAVAIATSASWKRAPEHVSDYGWPSLRSLAAILPVLVLLQVALGAAFRQRMAGLMPHIVGAIFVSLIILIVCAFTLQQCPTHTILRASAKTLMVITFSQVFLGIAAYTVRMMQSNPDARDAVLGFTAAHVTVGAFTLAASGVLSMQIRRNIVPKGSIPPVQAPSNQSSGPLPPGSSTAKG